MTAMSVTATSMTTNMSTSMSTSMATSMATGSPSDAHGMLGLGGLRLTRRGRAVLVALALVVSAGVGLLGTQAVASGPGEPVEVRLHTVAPGETLWEYASALADAGEDVRDVVAYLRELNDLRTAELRVGQVVLLPAD